MSLSGPQKYDALIIGSGQAGTPLAIALAKAGTRTCLIESVHIGGCCVNEGCTPTKTMITSGRVAYLARRGPDYGVCTEGSGENENVNDVRIDMKKVRARKRDIVTQFRTGTERRLREAGVVVLLGTARFVGEKTVSVSVGDGTERLLEGGKIFINAGERPAPFHLEGQETVDPGRVLDSTSIQELDEVPGHLIVVGGGYVGVEFAQLYRRLGSQVTILQRGKQLLGREDPEIADCFLSILQEDGLDVRLQSTALSISPSPSGFELRIQTRDTEESTVTGTHIVFATGRVPNSDTLNLEAAGIQTNRNGHIITDEYLTTTVPDVFALGDIKGPPAFTHISYDDFRIIQKNHITKPGATLKASTKNRVVPYVVYTDPQFGHVGLHEYEARAKYPEKQIQTAKMPMTYVARALETNETRGMMKVIVDGESGLILGFSCLGIEGGEVMSIVQMAMTGGVRWEALRDTIWAHPSLAESLNNIWEFLE